MSRDPLLASYFARIGFSGDTAPTLATLTALQGLQVQRIPFENLDPLLGRPVAIDTAAIAAKLVHGRRGGYCFEQNGLFATVLGALGFSVTALAARVVWMLPEDAPATPRTHRLSLVSLPDGAFVADVGFGGQSPIAPLRLVADIVQNTALATYRFVAHGAGFELQMRSGDRWCGMYRFTLEPQHQADFELGNWYTSAHPQSRFRNGLMASIVRDGRRYGLLNRQLSVRSDEASVTESTLPDAAALESLLQDVFELELPAPASAIWARLPA